MADYIAAMSDDYFVEACSRHFPKAREIFPRRGYFG